jgi:transposase
VNKITPQIETLICVSKCERKKRPMEKIFCGIDFHKNECVMCVKSEKGELIQPITTVKTRLLRQYLSNKKGWVIGFEASGGTNEMATQLKADEHEVIILNPNQLRGVTKSMKKTDRNDCQVIADALRLNFTPEVHLKSRASRELKSLLTNREILVRSRVNFTNHIRGTLREYGITMPQGAEEFRKHAASSIKQLSCTIIAGVLENILEQAKELERMEDQLEVTIQKMIQEDTRYALLQTMPGIGALTAAALISVVDDIKRFPDACHFAAYLGLVPRVRASAEMRMMGSITRSGPEIVRRYLIHGARAWMKYDPTPQDRDRTWAEAVKKRQGMNKATVALAHRMARIAFAMLRDNRAYQGRKKKKSGVVQASASQVDAEIAA